MHKVEIVGREPGRVKFGYLDALALRCLNDYSSLQFAQWESPPEY